MTSLAVNVTIGELGVDADADPGDLFPNSKEGVFLSYEIAINETTAIVEVETKGDNTWENHSKIEVKIVAGDSYTIDSESGTASVVVKDDEFVESEAVLSVSPNPIGEGMGKTIATITVTTKGDKRPHGKITMPLTIYDGTAKSGEDYTGIDTALTFSQSDFAQIDLDGNTRYRAFKTVDISIVQDSVDEDDESFSVDMGTSFRCASHLRLRLQPIHQSRLLTMTIRLSLLPYPSAPAHSRLPSPPTISPITFLDVGYGTHLMTIVVALPESRRCRVFPWTLLIAILVTISTISPKVSR